MSRAAAILALALGGCAVDAGDVGVWTPVEAIDGPLAAETGTAPARIAAADASTVRIVTFNVEMGADVQRIADAILADPALAGAGVLSLQEEEAYPGEGGSRAARLAAALGLGYVYVPARLKGTGTHGLAILSRYAIDDVEEMQLGYPGAGHQRIAVRADVHVGDRVLTMVDIHLETLLNVTDRLRQLHPAVVDLPDAVVVAGDFNTNHYVSYGQRLPLLPTSAVTDTEQAPIVDAFMAALGFATPCAGVGVTERKLGVATRLDAIYARGVASTAGTVERGVDVSDHWPVWVDVTLP